MAIGLLGKILIGGGIAGAGALGGYLLAGSGKKEQTIAQVQQPSIYAPYTIEPYATYAPTITKTYQPSISHQLDYMYAPQIRIESPGESVTTMETKKESTQQPSVTVIPTVSPIYSQTPSQVLSQEATQMDMGNLITMIIVGGVAIGILYVLTKKKK